MRKLRYIELFDAFCEEKKTVGYCKFPLYIRPKIIYDNGDSCPDCSHRKNAVTMCFPGKGLGKFTAFFAV